ncbi:hypothetical protein CRM22_008863 [Opisthorchis felineus]|uniref:Bestrophin homolog n=1 Tax=Opisthorchis felineus TaxID=147828 RepID=A0A4S2L9U2_OPIFE|nr:hypothetical protein CRM22_008863 [Opisthorchis felineus]
MTVPYASVVATTSYSTFLRLLFIWRGSVYRLIWFELLVFSVIYASLSLIYRFLLGETLRTYFEWACVYCSQNNDLIPVPFVLGFYVSLVVARWWEQFLALPWPDQLALYLTAYCHGNGERPTRIRRTVMRYVNLSYCLALRAISSRARLRFPTEDHLVSAGLHEMVSRFPTAILMYPKSDETAPIRLLPSEEATLRRQPEGPPWKRTATIVVYAYFTSCLLAWQYLDPSKAYPGYEVDIYVPIFGLLRFFFYMGWLKVAESLINPFGEDVDDFEIEYLIERNLNVSYLIVDEMHHDHPDLVRDAFWDTTCLSSPEWPKGAGDMAEEDMSNITGTDGDRFIGSLAHFDVTGRKTSSAFWRHGSISKPFASTSNLGKVSQL